MIDEPLKWSHFIDTSRTNAAAAAAAAAAVNLSSFLPARGKNGLKVLPLCDDNS